MAACLASVQAHSVCETAIGQIIVADASRRVSRHGCTRFRLSAMGIGLPGGVRRRAVTSKEHVAGLVSPSGLGLTTALRPIVRRAKRTLDMGPATQRRVPRVVMEAGGPAGATTEPSAEESMRDSKILPYCDISKRRVQKSLGEMEQEFLEALQSFYFDGKPTMTNEEFDNLKEELLWEGSSVAILSAEEQRFMEASMAYADGKMVMTDEAYDQLKFELKKQGSKVVLEGPRCSLRTRKVYSDLTVDYLRMTLLNLPAALIALGIVFFLDDITGFEITYLLELPEPYSFLFTWVVVLPVVYLIARSLTNIVVKEPLILKGPCPECGEDNISFFGTILTVAGNTGVNAVQCASCKTPLLFDLEKRWIELDDNPKKKGPAAAKGAKKAAPKKTPDSS